MLHSSPGYLPNKILKIATFMHLIFHLYFVNNLYSYAHCQFALYYCELWDASCT